MITTNSYVLDKNTYTNILLVNSLKQRFWVLSLLAAMMLYGLVLKQSFLIIFPPIYVLWIVAYLMIFARRSKNPMFKLEMNISFNESNIYRHQIDGAEDLFEMEQIFKIVVRKQYFLIYTSTTQFIYLPKNAFMNSADMEAFEKYFNAKIGR